MVSYARVLIRVREAREDPGDGTNIRQSDERSVGIQWKGGLECTRFIEGYMAVFANAGEEKLDAAVLLYACLICVAFCYKVGYASIEDVDL